VQEALAGQVGPVVRGDLAVVLSASRSARSR
jgi:hypothetical protein